MFWQILPSILFMFDITSWTSILNKTVLKDTEILLPSLGLIKHIHDMINLLYYGHWTDKQKYIPFISVTHKKLKSCRNKMATWAQEVYDVHEASSLYKKTCWWSSYICIYNIYRGDGGSPPASQKFANSPLPARKNPLS